MIYEIKEYHVSKQGNDLNEGSKEFPFLTISKAAEVAHKGSTIIVHEGIYREWVKPARGGDSELRRITYLCAEGETVEIKGSEQISTWENIEGDVWSVKIDNVMFGEYNPYKEILYGDWYLYDDINDIDKHPGEVYLNGKSLYEVATLEGVIHPTKRVDVLCPDDTLFTWFAEVHEEHTVIYANFQGSDPNKELTEINVRQCCFFPDKLHVDYITIKGFKISQAATLWSPPTAKQMGMIGPNWSKGWIIENCEISDAKCSAICLGKEESTGNNLSSIYHLKSGYQYQMEAVFDALEIGWSKEKVGSHIIKNNSIHDCGQNGIVGHMGCAFSIIDNNEIYNIAVKREFTGYEIAGIKFHAPIDVQIESNYIHDCTLGIWLDWQTQGARISKNILCRNGRDLMVEVSHGPYIVDHNILASDINLDNWAQGGAYLHNLFLGVSRHYQVMDRATPYHYPHTTKVAGVTFVYGGDDRYYNNIYVKRERNYDDIKDIHFRESEDDVLYNGNQGYDKHPISMEEYMDRVIRIGVKNDNKDHGAFKEVVQPVYLGGNVFYNGALPMQREENYYQNKEFDASVKVVEEDGALYLEMQVDIQMLKMNTDIISTNTLGVTRIVEGIYDNVEGQEIIFDTDMIGVRNDCTTLSGPIMNLKAGSNKVQVWKKSIS